ALLAAGPAQCKPPPAPQTFPHRCSKNRQPAPATPPHRQIFSAGSTPSQDRFVLLNCPAAKVPPPQIGPLPLSNRSNGDKFVRARAALQIGQGLASSWPAERPSRRAGRRSFLALGRTQMYPSHHSGARLAAVENSRQLCRNFPKPFQADPVV